MDQPATVDLVTVRGSVGLEVDGAIAQLVLRRSEKRNALSSSMIADLHDRVRELANDTTVRVVLVRGSGGRAFSAGADTVEFENTEPEAVRGPWTRAGQSAFAAVAELPQTTIAVLDAGAFGGGFELALHCDFRVAAPNIAVGLPESTLGTTPGWSGLSRIVELAGVPAARLLAMTGRSFDATRAYELGLIDIVSADPDEAAQHLASDILATGPIAQSIVKRVLSSTVSQPGMTALIDSLAGAYCAATGETAAFMSNRTRGAAT